MSHIKTTQIEQIILNIQVINYLSNRLDKLVFSYNGIKNPSESTQEQTKIIEDKLNETVIEIEKIRDEIIEFLGNIDALDELDISFIQNVVNATKLK